MTYTPQLFPSEQDRIVPHDEGITRLAQIRATIEAQTDRQLEKRVAALEEKADL